MKKNKQYLFAYLDENKQPILTEMHLSTSCAELEMHPTISNNTKEDLISNIRIAVKVLDISSNLLEQLRDDLKEAYKQQK